MNSALKPLVCCLLDHVRKGPARTAFLAGDSALSFREFWDMIMSIAARLRRRRVAVGDRVLLCGPNSPQLAAGYFAIHSVGAVAAFLDVDSPADAAQRVVEDCEPCLAMMMTDLPLSVPIEDLRVVDACSESDRLFDPVCRLDDVADLLYTSGATGSKKGVVLTHRNIAQAAMNINAFIQSNESDVEVVPMPLSHSFGLGRLRTMCQTGNTIALEAGMFNAARLLKRVLDLRATGLAMVPAGFELLLRMTKDRLADAQPHLRYIEIGSAAMRPETKRRLMEYLPRTRICHHYGLTEASRAAFCEYHADRLHGDSIGRASPNVEISVRDPAGRELPPGETGELTVRGDIVMKEYWRQPSLTAEALRDGWLHTGDCGYRDADGYLYLVGRKGDLINVAGMKVNPEEVERALCEHPQVVDAACVAQPDPQGITGDCVKAFVVSGSPVPPAELVAWLRPRLEEYKIPRIWDRVSRIPKTASGKIQRHLLRSTEAGHGS